MVHKLIIKPGAEQDLREALEWYKKERSGLEVELYRKVTEVFEDIAKNPEQYQKRYRNIRIRYTRKFKYGVHYTIEDDMIYVHAILHTSRKPRK